MGSLFHLDEPPKRDSGNSLRQPDNSSGDKIGPSDTKLIFPALAGIQDGGEWIVDRSQPAAASPTNIFADLALNPLPGGWRFDPQRPIAKFSERVFPTIALGGLPGPWTLDPNFDPPPERDLFATQMRGELPATRNLASSVVLHGVILTLMMTITIPVSHPVEVQQELSPTEIRIGDHLYYVADISGQEQGQASPASAKKDLPRAASVGKSGTPSPAPVRAQEPAASAAAIPAPSLSIPAVAAAPAAVEAAAKAATEAAAAMTREQAVRTETARREAKRALTKAFIPPQVKRSPTATQTLIQPLSPPDLVPPSTPLPSFRVMTPQFPKLSRRFVAPGRKTELPPAPAPVAEPDIQLAQAQPVDTDLMPKLPLPSAPPPPSPVKPAPTPAPANSGEPINILSVSDRAVPLSDRIVVPPGNIVQEAPVEAAASAGTGTSSAPASSTATASTGSPGGRGAAGATTAPATSAAQASTNGSGRGTTASGPGPANSRGTSQTPALANTAPGGTGLGNSPVPRPGAGAGAGAVAVVGSGSGNQTGNGAAGSGEGRGRGAVGAGTGSALAGGSPTGNPAATVGGTGGTATGGDENGTGSGGSGSGSGMGTNGTGGGNSVPGLINRSPSGTFDAVVVQTSPLDQYPETRGLLTGRPIYSVYVSVGTQRDWTLFYCVPNERPPLDNSNAVNLGGPQPAPVKAPYPYRMLRPQVKLPTWAKYVLVHAYVNAEGKLEGMKVVRSVLPDIDKAVLASLTEWEFRAASRNNAPVAVEVLLSIPAAGI
ncbi:MAG: hypothetical protein ABL967_00040 [Bryobacteraceae bacterium]